MKREEEGGHGQREKNSNSQEESLLLRRATETPHEASEAILWQFLRPASQ